MKPRTRSEIFSFILVGLALASLCGATAYQDFTRVNKNGTVSLVPNFPIEQAVINNSTVSGQTFSSPAITGTVSGGASYTSPTITGPTISGTVAGGASYTSPTISSPSFTGAIVTGAGFARGSGATCANAAGVGAACNTTITWGSTLSSSTYTALCEIDSPNLPAHIGNTSGKTTTQMNVSTVNDSATAVTTGTVRCIGLP